MEWKFPRHTHFTELAAFSFLKAITECSATDKEWVFFSSSGAANRAGNTGLRNTGSRVGENEIRACFCNRSFNF